MMMEDRTARFLKRRDRITIYLNILEAIQQLSSTSPTKRAKITHVLYKSNLNTKRLKERLQELSYLDLITWDNTGLKLTEKGKTFLQEYQNLINKINQYIKTR
ncbi:MAG: winged helix-turn-helix domain-containing protein [archaeon YNP-LCB-003-016]|uniref:winged helix-turn-helix domain-containing protein n=1 Tax=Candidatus Culexarchaeum yellowstonense TaxID=2928963 RepID=UPI0026F34CF4|nr:winged helix-turn-helix domain-containing protein [Candidatus Culexarchaeum yellowstonense]MCR6692724.1 winged helix-turn-helix domain-containing protein [Candidatus Culexarchaeum yellowstonense]